jgi:hypothetical protein
MLGRGKAGSSALRLAIDQHLPELALTRSVLEERFLALCEANALPLPEVNATISRFEVDALWRDERVIVELDGYAAHGTAMAIERDRAREVVLRSAGFVVLRYTWHQVTHEPQDVVADLLAALGSGRTDAIWSRPAVGDGFSSQRGS